VIVIWWCEPVSRGSKNPIQGIYRIFHKDSGKTYVGQSKDIPFRWKHHRESLNGGYHYNFHLQSAWVRYGEKAFGFEILEMVADSKDLSRREGHYCDLYQAHDRDHGYNLRKVNPDGSCEVSKETREKLAVLRRGKPLPLDTRLKVSKTLTGRKGPPCTEEAKEKSRVSHLGKGHTEESKRKISGSRITLFEGRRAQGVVTKHKQPRTEENRRKISEARRGMKASEEAKRHMSESRRAYNQRMGFGLIPEKEMKAAAYQTKKYLDLFLRAADDPDLADTLFALQEGD